MLIDVTADIKAGRLGLPIVQPLTPGKPLLETLPPERTRDGSQTLLLITPQIINQQDDEELLPSAKAR